ncbi:MAG: hypothetical protein ACFCUO_07465 [Rhodospirillales bacterium]
MQVTDKDAHRQHKREAFDGMRAYHQSEISHKKDAIDILKAVLTSILVVYGGIVGALITKQIEYRLAISISVIILIFILAIVIGLVYSTNEKIDQDNKRYRSFRKEYINEIKALNLESDRIQNKLESAWADNIDESKTGYHYTKVIIRLFGILVVGTAAMGTAIILSLSLSG